jgi:hypothetical protein
MPNFPKNSFSKEPEQNPTRLRPFTKKPATLDREELEYTAQKIFTYATIGFAAIGIYAALSYLVVQQLKK